MKSQEYSAQAKPEGLMYWDRKLEDAGSTNIWGRVDLARLYVLHHELMNTPAKNIFYVDMDFEDVKLNNRELQNILRKYFIVIGKIQNGVYENGFFGFTNSDTSREYMSGLIHETEKSVACGGDGYTALGIYSDKFFSETVPFWQQEITLTIQPPLQYQVPENEAIPLL